MTHGGLTNGDQVGARRVRLQRAAAVALAMAMVVAACGPGEPGPPAHVAAGPVQGGTLVLGMQQEPDVLTPVLSRMRAANYVGQMIFSYFARMDDGFRLVPDLLVEIPARDNGGISEDGTTIVYRLRPDVVWHDGTPLTSADVRFTYNLMVDSSYGVTNAHGWDGVIAVEAPDPQTVVFQLDKPNPSFIADAFVDEPVLPQHLLAGIEPRQFRQHPYHRAPIGSGAFRLASWESGSRIVLERFADYFGDGPYLDRIVLRVIPDAESLASQLATGEIHGFDNASALMAPRLDRLEDVALFRTPGTVYEHLDMNCQKQPLDDVRVRRAIAMAIDRDAISQGVYDALWPPAYSDEPPSSPLYDPGLAELTAFDPERARSLLSEAGWRPGGDGIRERDGRRLELQLFFPAGRPDRERVGVLLRSQLQRVGVQVELRPVEATVFFSSASEGGILQGGRFDLALFAWSAPPDPSVKELIYSQDFIPPQGQNVSRLRDAQLSELLRDASREMDPERRRELYRQAGRRVAELAPVVPLVWRTQLDPMTARLRNFRPNPTISGNSWNAADWWLAPVS